jgi:hypothetical protein
MSGEIIDVEAEVVGAEETDALVLVEAGAEPPFSQAEEQRKAELEAKIAEKAEAFLEVCLALKEIQEKRLYRIPGLPREKYTFKSYCLDHFDLSKSRAYQLVKSADVLENIKKSTIVDFLPTNEAQLRPLTALPAEKQAEAWAEAVKSAPESRPTATHVKRVADELRAKPVKKAVGKAAPGEIEDRLSPDFNAALKQLMKVIEKESRGGWKKTDPKIAAYKLRGVVAALEA